MDNINTCLFYFFFFFGGGCFVADVLINLQLPVVLIYLQ